MTKEEFRNLKVNDVCFLELPGERVDWVVIDTGKRPALVFKHVPTGKSVKMWYKDVAILTVEKSCILHRSRP